MKPPIAGNKSRSDLQRWRWPLNASGNLAAAAALIAMIAALSVASC